MSRRELYDVLGLEPNATDVEIAKAYKVLARTHHPDKGGDEETFKKVQHAYDVLGDPKTREYYDMTGSDNIGGGGGGGGMPFGGGGGMPFGFNMADLFGAGFAGFGSRGGGFNSSRRPGKAPARVEKLPLSLSQFYHGGVVNISLNREKFCTSCKGKGSKVLKTCEKCGGSGQSVQDIMIGPGMMMRTQGPCGQCEGKGEQRGDNCGDCSGKGLVRQHKNIEVRIAPGSSAGETLVFENEASDCQEYEIGSADLHIIFENADDLYGWTREGRNLRNNVSISLVESLCGCTVSLEGWPGSEEADHKVHIAIPRGIQNGEEVVVSGKGFSGGNIILKVRVAVNESEQRVLVEHKESLAGIFGYHLNRDDSNVWSSTNLSTL